MKRALKISAHAARKTVESGILHFRLCHVCLHLNEAENDVTECEACQCTFTGDNSWEIGRFGRPEQSKDSGDDEPVEGDPKAAMRLTGLSVVW